MPKRSREEKSSQTYVILKECDGYCGHSVHAVEVVQSRDENIVRQYVQTKYPKEYDCGDVIKSIYASVPFTDDLSEDDVHTAERIKKEEMDRELRRLAELKRKRNEDAIEELKAQLVELEKERELLTN